jgi:hypothetical protein
VGARIVRFTRPLDHQTTGHPQAGHEFTARTQFHDDIFRTTPDVRDPLAPQGQSKPDAGRRQSHLWKVNLYGFDRLARDGTR